MPTAAYEARKLSLETYFDRTAFDAWAALTSDAPVSRVRATVRAGRARMRARLLDWLGQDLTGRRVLDAGCGTGALAVEAARRGAEVVAIDVAASLVTLAADRAPAGLAITWRSGDMLDPALGRFDHVVAMDSLIHYEPDAVARAVAGLAARAERSVVFTFAPRTPLLAMMHAGGKLFPRRDRSPAIVPVSETRLRRLLAEALPNGPEASSRGSPAGSFATGRPTATDAAVEPRHDALFRPCRPGRTERVSAGFYISQALEVAR